jgi:hypothetical protein
MGDPGSNGIIRACQPPSHVCMQAFDTLAGSTDTSVGSRAGPSGRKECITNFCVPSMRISHQGWGYLALSLFDAALRLQPGHRAAKNGVHQPKMSRHRCAISQKWFVGNHHGLSIRPS